jgi:DNA-binding CsgD family transcriptional regulator
MSIDERMSAVVAALYDAASDESLWPEALRALVEFTGSQAATFWVLDGSDEPRLPTLVTLNFDPRFMREYLDEMVPLDPTVQYLVRHPEAAIVHDGLVISEREKDRHAYYDWHGGWSDTRFRLVGQARPAPLVQAGVALHRTRRGGRFESADIESFSSIRDHLQRALSIGVRLDSLGAMQEGVNRILDDHRDAILLLDARERVVYANRRAQDLQAADDGIRFSCKGVELDCRPDHERLRRLCADALNAGEPGVKPGADVMRARRRSGGRPYGISVTPCARRFAALASLRPAICLQISDPEFRLPLVAERIGTAFGLTDAEARMVSILVGGNDLRQAAGQLHITYGTARARLAEIFAKTDTRRQAELVSLVLTTLRF